MEIIEHAKLDVALRKKRSKVRVLSDRFECSRNVPNVQRMVCTKELPIGEL